MSVTIEHLFNPQEDEEEFKNPALSSATVMMLLRQLDTAIINQSNQISKQIAKLKKYKSVVVQSAVDMELEVSLNVNESSLCKDINYKIAELESRGKSASNVKSDLITSINTLIKGTIQSVEQGHADIN
jgi:hypothetical protein